MENTMGKYAETSAARPRDLWFSLSVENEEIIAFISIQALCEHFQASGDMTDCRTAYRKHSRLIHSRVLEKIKNGSMRPIRLDSSDFEDNT